MELRDPNTQRGARVNNNGQLSIFSTIQNQFQSASKLGNSYNINTGIIDLSTTGVGTLLYFLNDESPVNGESDYVVTAIVVGIGSLSTVTDSALITVVRNPIAGDIITDASDVASKGNSNFGSSNSLSSTTMVYKGKDGGTMTGGEDYGFFYANANSRMFATLDIDIPRGTSIGIKIDTNSAGGNVYAALIGHRQDGNLT